MIDSVKHGALCELFFTVNGERRTVHAYPMERLLDALRGQLGLTGAKDHALPSEEISPHWMFQADCSLGVDGSSGVKAPAVSP